MKIEQEIKVGEEIVIVSESTKNSFAVVFEDNGQTGYFYALENRQEENQILDALHIYNVEEAGDKNILSLVKIIWSKDELKSLLLIDDYPHAVFDFELKRGYCRKNFPVADKTWTNFNHNWNDKALDLFE
ncbi:MAG: DUF2251 domain-containing protein [Acidobacteriota bacterium]|nr:DUF2251 domain-containing protein [Acidobacteriota bacterium]